MELVVRDATDSPNSASYLGLYFEHDVGGVLKTRLYGRRDDFDFPVVDCPFLDGDVPSSPACGVCVSRLVRCSGACGSCRDFLRRSVLLAGVFSIGVSWRLDWDRCLRVFWGRCRRLALPCRVSVAAVADGVCGPWCCCRGCVSFLDATWGASWRVPRSGREVFALPERLVSSLVFMEVPVVLSFVSPCFMLWSCLLFFSFWLFLLFGYLVSIFFTF